MAQRSQRYCRLGVLVLSVFCFLQAFPPCLAEATMSMENILEEVQQLDLRVENLVVASDKLGEIPLGDRDRNFMDLVKAKIRLSRLVMLWEMYNPEDDDLSFTYDITTLFNLMEKSGAMNMEDKPFDLSTFLVQRIILPWELQAFIRELSRYYDGVVSFGGWQKKFDIMLDTDERYGPSLNNGKIFHLAGFPVIHQEELYQEPLQIELKDGSFVLYEFDSSMEGWLYSFWLRRYQEGSMDVAKKILDWLNSTPMEVDSTLPPPAEKIPSQASPEDLYALGKDYQHGRNGKPRNESKAVEYYRYAAEAGLQEAQCDLGYMYDLGKGVPENDKVAVMWYTRAARQGDATAQANLAYMYEQGYGIRQDPGEAAFWYRKAAEQGDPRGQCNLGYLYDHGKGVKEDPEEAVYWFREAAEQGEALAQSNLGIMYENGRGVEKNIKKALFWYNKAAEQGNESAKKSLARLGALQP